jgi:hypothetical protein
VSVLKDNDEDDNELDGEDFYGSERPIDIPYPDEDSEDVDEEDVEAALANEQTEEENIGISKLYLDYQHLDVVEIKKFKLDR